VREISNGRKTAIASRRAQSSYPTIKKEKGGDNGPGMQQASLRGDNGPAPSSRETQTVFYTRGGSCVHLPNTACVDIIGGRATEWNQSKGKVREQALHVLYEMGQPREKIFFRLPGWEPLVDAQIGKLIVGQRKCNRTVVRKQQPKA